MVNDLESRDMSKLLPCNEEESVEELNELAHEVDPCNPCHPHTVTIGVWAAVNILTYYNKENEAYFMWCS